MSPTAVCVFAKAPLPGVTKTRLAPALGRDGAAAMARAFLVDVWAGVRALPWARPVFATTQPLDDDLARELRGDAATLEVWLQGDGDFSARLTRIVERSLASGSGVIVIGGDSPGLPPRLVEEAREALRAHDAVLGPCDDGGFYLVGLGACPEGLFDDLPWSRADTFEKTLARFQERALRTAVLDPWFDVDEPGDLARLRDLLAQGLITAPATSRALASIAR